jgi:hypothetical protein
MRTTPTGDGVTRDIPIDVVPPDPTVIGDTGETVFAGKFPTPTGRSVEVVLAGETTVVDLLPAFAVSAPSAPVSRSAGVIVLTYDVLAGAHAVGDETVTCGAETFRIDTLTVTTPGQLAVPVDDVVMTGPCTHAVRIHQTVDSRASAITTSSARTASTTLQSVP